MLYSIDFKIVKENKKDDSKILLSIFIHFKEHQDG